jgi:hypothetical protein
MKARRHHIYKLAAWMLFLLVGVQACRDPYTPDLDVRDADAILVVDGFIDISGSSNFKIAFSSPIVREDGTNSYRQPSGPVRTANVSIVSSANQSYPAQYNPSSGVYEIVHGALDPNQTYFVRIQVGQDVYESQPAKALRSGEIQNVEYEIKDDGIEILVSSDDANHATPYYRWEFKEAWRFNSPVQPTVFIQNGELALITPDNLNYGSCFRFDQSRNILIASTREFAENKIFKMPVQSIPNYSEKISLRYSILVKQYAISPEAYNFWELIKKNSEQIGDIFGVMPSEINGNIRNVNDPLEKVIGFVEVLQPTEKRIFINNFHLPMQWMGIKDIPFYNGCRITDTVKIADAMPFFNQFPGYLPGWYIYANPASAFPTDVNYAPARCVDCRFYGQLERPAYWTED